MRTFARCVALLVVVFFAGCATVDVKSVGGFKQGLSEVQTHSKALLLGVNKLARAAQLERIETLPGMIKESDVAPALDAESVAEWNLALEALSAYASSIEVLSDPERGTDVEKPLLSLGRRIHVLVPEPEKHVNEIKVAVGHLGDVVVRAAANWAALELMKEADANVRAVLTQMADMIGDGVTQGGVRGTVWSNWTTLATETRAPFVGAGAAEKRRIAVKFADCLDMRASSDAALASVRKQLLDLADVHTALAQGRVADAKESIAFLREQIAVAREFVGEWKKNSGEAK